MHKFRCGRQHFSVTSWGGGGGGGGRVTVCVVCFHVAFDEVPSVLLKAGSHSVTGLNRVLL